MVVVDVGDIDAAAAEDNTKGVSMIKSVSKDDARKEQWSLAIQHSNNSDAKVERFPQCSPSKLIHFCNTVSRARNKITTQGKKLRRNLRNKYNN